MLDMAPKHRRAVIFVCMLIMAFFGTIVGLNSEEPPEITSDHIQDSALIMYPTEWNYRQTINDCGPYSAAAVLRIKTNREIDSAEIVEEMSWRLPNNYTIPWGLEELLKDYDITIATPDVSSLSDSTKLQFLYEQLSLGHPLIILGERDNYEHFITLLGYNTNKNC